MMNSTQTEFCVRPAREWEVEAIQSVIVSAYNLAEGSDRWNHMRRIAQDWQHFLVMDRHGQIVGVVRVGRDLLRYGESATLFKAEVGYVGIRRELHGQGLGTALMQAAVKFIKEQGFQISRLGGLNRFYGRFGYVPFPRRYYEFSLEPIGAGAKNLTPEMFLEPSPEEQARLRLYDPGRDWLERCRLYDLFHANHIGAMIESRPPTPQTGGPDITGLKWVYDEGGIIRAYAFASMSGTMVELYDVGADFAYPHALAAVVKRVLWEAVRKGARQAQGRLPFDTRVETALVNGRVSYVLREVQSAPASNMLLLVDLERFFEAVTPEWIRRLRQAGGSPWTGVLEFQVQEQTAKIELSTDGVKVVEKHARPDMSLSIAPRDFLLTALGHRSWCEIAHEVSGYAPPALSHTLSILFSRAPCASGPLG